MKDSHTWKHNVDGRISIIADGLRSNDELQQNLPGLEVLLNDCLDPEQAVGTDSDQHGFHRRLLQVFRDSPADSAYQDWLDKLQPDEQKRVGAFVDGTHAQDVCQGFQFKQSLGARQHIESLAKSSPVIVNGLSNDKDVDKGGSSIFRRLLCGLHIPSERHKRDSVQVSQAWISILPSFADLQGLYIVCLPTSSPGAQRRRV